MSKPRYKAWYGGVCPVPLDQRVEAIIRIGDIVIGKPYIINGFWKHRDGHLMDIIAYRVLEGESCFT